MEREKDILIQKDVWEDELKRIIFGKKDDAFDIMSYHQLNGGREESYENIRNKVENLVHEGILTPKELMYIVQNNDLQSRLINSINFIRAAAIFCKKAGIDIKKTLVVASDMFINSHNIKEHDFEVLFNEDAFAVLQQLMGDDELKQALNSPGGIEIVLGMETFGQVFQRMKLLFFLFDYYAPQQDIHIQPSLILQELLHAYGEDETIEDIFILGDFFQYTLRTSLKKEISFDLNTTKKLFSQENILAFVESKDWMNGKSEILSFIKVIEKLNNKSVLSIDILNSKIWYQGMAKKISMRNVAIGDIDADTLLEKSKQQKLSFWEVILLNILTIKVKEIFEESGITLDLPEDVQKYGNDYFFDNKNRLFKNLFTHVHEKINHWELKDGTLLRLLDSELPRSMGQTTSLISFLEKALVTKESVEVYSEQLLSLRFQLYNRPFDIQKSFYSFSGFLINCDNEIYQFFLEKLLLLSKQNRKHFVEKIVPLMEMQLLFLKEIQLPEEDADPEQEAYSPQKKVNKTYTRNVSRLIESIFKKAIEGMPIEEIKQDLEKSEDMNVYKENFLKEGLGLSNPKTYIYQNHELTELFFTYACNLSEKTKKNITSVGLMLAANKTDTWDELRVNKKVPQKEFTPQGQEIIKEILNLEERAYRLSDIDQQTLLELQKTVDHTVEILPQTLGEKLFNIQESFEELYDPDIYENEEIKEIAKMLYQKDKKQHLRKKEKRLLKEEELPSVERQFPIVNFIDDIEHLQFNKIIDELKLYQEAGSGIPKELSEIGERTIEDALGIFKKIVVAYENAHVSDTAQIRIEEIANNFSVEVDEITRLVSPSLEINGAVKIRSSFTNNMVEIIKNIRGCLGCMGKNSYNAKNLQFLSPNRFIIFSGQEEDTQSNIADQLCILSQTDQGLCFILDKLYGARMSKILVNHGMTVIQKIQSSKDVSIKIFIPQESIRSAGTNISHFQSLLHAECMKENINITLQQMQITPNTDYLGYQEFGIKEGNKDGNIEGLLISIQ